MKYSELTPLYNKVKSKNNRTEADHAIIQLYDKYLYEYHSEYTPKGRKRFLNHVLFGVEDHDAAHLADKLDIPNVDDGVINKIKDDYTKALNEGKIGTEASPKLEAVKSVVADLGSPIAHVTGDVLNLLSIPQSALVGLMEGVISNPEGNFFGNLARGMVGLVAGATTPVVKLLDNFNPSEKELTDLYNGFMQKVGAAGLSEDWKGGYLPSELVKKFGADPGFWAALTMDVLADPIIMQGAISKARMAGRVGSSKAILMSLDNVVKNLEGSKIAKLKEIDNTATTLRKQIETTEQAIEASKQARKFDDAKQLESTLDESKRKLEEVLKPVKDIEVKQEKVAEVGRKLDELIVSEPSAERSGKIVEEAKKIDLPEDATKVITREAVRTKTTTGEMLKAVDNTIAAYNEGISEVGRIPLTGMKKLMTALLDTNIGKTVSSAMPFYRNPSARALAEELSRAYEQGKQVAGKADELEALSKEIDKLKDSISELMKRQEEVRQSEEELHKHYGVKTTMQRHTPSTQSSFAQQAKDAEDEFNFKTERLTQLENDYNRLNNYIYKEVLQEFVKAHPELSEDIIARLTAVTNPKVTAYIKAASNRLVELRQSLKTLRENDAKGLLRAARDESISKIKNLTNDLTTSGDLFDSLHLPKMDYEALDKYITNLEQLIDRFDLDELQGAIEGLNALAGDGIAKNFDRITPQHLGRIIRTVGEFDRAHEFIHQNSKLLKELKLQIDSMLDVAKKAVNPKYKELVAELDALVKNVNVLAEPLATPTSVYPHGMLHLKNEKLGMFLALTDMNLPKPFRPMGEVVPDKVRVVHLIVPTDDGLEVKKYIGRSQIDNEYGRMNYTYDTKTGKMRSFGWWIPADAEGTKLVKELEALNGSLYKQIRGVFGESTFGKTLNQIDSVIVRLALSPLGSWAWAASHALGSPLRRFYTFSVYHTQNLIGNLINSLVDPAIARNPIRFAKSLHRWAKIIDDAAKVEAELAKGVKLEEIDVALRNSYKLYLERSTKIGSGINKSITDALRRNRDDFVKELTDRKGKVVGQTISRGDDAKWWAWTKDKASRLTSVSVEIGSVQDFVFRAAAYDVIGDAQKVYKLLGHMSARTPLEIHSQSFLKFLPWIRYNMYHWLDSIAANPTYVRFWKSMHDAIERDDSQETGYDSATIDDRKMGVDVGRYITVSSVDDPIKVVTTPFEAAYNKLKKSPKSVSLPYTGVIRELISFTGDLGKAFDRGIKAVPLRLLATFAKRVRPLRELLTDLDEAYKQSNIGKMDVDVWLGKLTERISGVPVRHRGATIYWLIKSLEKSDASRGRGEQKYGDVIRRLKLDYHDAIQDYLNKAKAGALEGYFDDAD